jgi:hypothetical protein
MVTYSKAAMERAIGEEDHAVGRQQKKMAARRGCGKDARWKSQKTDFPTPLGNPANPAGFPLSHSLGGGGRFTKTGHFICYEKLQARATLMALCFLSQRNDALRKGGHF